MKCYRTDGNIPTCWKDNFFSSKWLSITLHPSLKLWSLAKGDFALLETLVGMSANIFYYLDLKQWREWCSWHLVDWGQGYAEHPTVQSPLNKRCRAWEILVCMLGEFAHVCFKLQLLETLRYYFPLKVLKIEPFNKGFQSREEGLFCYQDGAKSFYSLLVSQTDVQ